MKAEIHFEIISDNLILPKDFSRTKHAKWLKDVAIREQKELKLLSYAFCDDAFLLDLNQEYLKHDTLTDIITFPYNTNPIEAEIYISFDRVKENAIAYSQGNTLQELQRVLVHGLLHMCGYDDHDHQRKQEMRAKEAFYLDLL